MTAMASYFFDLAFDGRPEPAREAVELSGPSEARSEARALAAEMVKARPESQSVTVSVRDSEPDPLTSVLRFETGPRLVSAPTSRAGQSGAPARGWGTTAG